ncbi:MAG TPA: YciC family protein [Allosphingosinicella sp.]|nr:YciC family protein [Allosphingosinicella sp.]
MATAAAAGNDRNVSMGRIFSRAFGTLGSNPVATFGIAFLFGALPSLVLAYFIQTVRAESLSVLGPAGMIAISIFSAVVAVVLGMITQGALVRATTAYSEGRKASLGESAMAGLSVALPLFLLGLLSALGLALGFLLLLVPGIILYVMWSVAAPALVEERLGPVEALGRSNRLTDGVRWKVFGLTLVVVVAYWIFSGIVAMLTIAWYGGMTEFATMSAGGGMPLGYLLINGIAATLTSAVWGVIQTSLYVELRDWKDGPRTEALADIFG